MSINRVNIDLSALVHNLGLVRETVGPGVQVMGIVKSDAYGHGLLPISNTLVEHGIDRLGVAFLHEALELRNIGIKTPIVILCGIRTRQEARAVIEAELTPVLFDLQAIEILAEEAARRDKGRISVQLKIDTGMGRLGIPLQEAGEFLGKLKGYKHLKLEALLSHLSSADDESSPEFNELQIERFEGAVKRAREQGFELSLNNMANSAGIMACKKSYFDMVRPGIMLYGGLPSPEFSSQLPLRPVMNLTGRVLQVREFPDKSPVSYGRTYYTKGERKIAVTSIGYGDGLPRELSNTGNALIKGIKADIVGRVCMNMTMVDVTGIEDIQPGRDVVFLGAQKEEMITGEEIAGLCKTISYELFCSIGHKNSREYIR